ncbi:MAG TPA: hypothetical protein VGC16_00150 [Rhizomicrobium sp.]
MDEEVAAMNRRTAIVILALLTGPLSALAAPPEVAGVIKSDKPYSQGRLRVLFITAYDATLWTDAPGWSWDAPFALTFNYHIGFDTDDIVSRSITEMKHVDPGLSDADVARLTPQLNKAFPPVRSGEHYTALYAPGQPIRVWLNGRETGGLDAAFARDFFGMWLSPNTSQPALRTALLKLK